MLDKTKGETRDIYHRFIHHCLCRSGLGKLFFQRVRYRILNLAVL